MQFFAQRCLFWFTLIFSIQSFKLLLIGSRFYSVHPTNIWALLIGTKSTRWSPSWNRCYNWLQHRSSSKVSNRTLSFKIKFALRYISIMSILSVYLFHDSRIVDELTDLNEYVFKCRELSKDQPYWLWL